MEIKDIVNMVANFLQLSNIIDADLDDFDNLDLQTKKDINLIVSCINEVLSDVATDFLPLKATEKITIQNGEFDFDNLSRDFHKLISVSPAEKYSVDGSKLKLRDGSYELTYSYLPEQYELDDEVTDIDKKVTIYALCFGVAEEFCMISGNYAESEMWGSKFQNAMCVCARPSKMPSLKERRWA